MAITDLEEKIIGVDQRVSKLENSNKQEEILDILYKIKNKLLGSLESDSPGIFNDVKQLKENEKITQSQLTNINANIEQLLRNQIVRMNFENEIETIKKNIDELKKFTYKVMGGIIVISFIVSHIGELWSMIAKGTGAH